MKSDDSNTGAKSLIDGVATRARLALAWEGVWPWIAAATAVVVMFLAVSWFGVWDLLPPYARMAGVLLFAGALVAALAPLMRAAWPDRRAALARVDRESGLAHRPATSLDDRLASVSGEDPMTRALWAAHRARAEAAAKGLKAGAPSPKLAARDPYALRFLLGLIAVAAFAVAGSDRGERVLAAFDWTSPAADTVPARVDAWVAPPGYTGRPPIFLTARAGGAAESPKPDSGAAAIPDGGGAEPIRAPQNATLVVRGSGGPVEVSVSGAAEEQKSEAKLPEGVVERKFKLVGDAEATIVSPGAPDRRWVFSVIPDQPPSIELAGPLKLNARGTATIPYEIKDDYGVAAAEARFRLKPSAAALPPVALKNPKPAPAAAPARPLYEAPKVALGLPRAKARDGKAEAPLDTMEHPFAGAEATMTLVARDDAGQEGVSKPLEMRLPAREFTKPLARALVEQRRTLALDAGAKQKVLQGLRALAMFPEQFTPKAGQYLGLTTAYRRLEIAGTDDELRGAADYLWEIALRIEDGDLPEAERDLRAAEEALRKALENGASEEEIKKLTQDLRAALEKFMKEMAEQQRQNGNQQQAQKGQKGAKEIRPQDLRNMIDKMEKLAQSGAKDAAKQALADLKNMLDNLKNAKPQASDPNQQAQQQQMDKLQEMIREQSKLRDQTFQQYRQNERQQRNQRGKPQQGQEGEQKLKELAERQEQLRQQLDQMMKQQGERQEQAEGQQGQQQEQQDGEKQEGRQRRPGGDRGQGEKESQGEGDQPGQNALGEAGKSMGQAKGALGQGQTGEALDQQQKALEQLRKGAQAMAEQQGQGQPGQQGQDGQQGARNGEEGRDDDPLGRPVRRRESDGDTTKVPGEIDAQRARRVIEELRKRLGEADRPRDELDYLERLLTP
ncbi:TIGR02302 family protein [Methylopila sp. M107]|uniref:TIGR02302 family protein n=1 Tax=Methylopila sp. M107 TaxID=1101190 RepID=UPI0003794AD2|nr:TIGR02302 family protein [Methylopila sp. M107]